MNGQELFEKLNSMSEDERACFRAIEVMDMESMHDCKENAQWEEECQDNLPNDALLDEARSIGYEEMSKLCDDVDVYLDSEISELISQYRFCFMEGIKHLIKRKHNSKDNIEE